jgi:AcrR family transcriptional regulator
MRRLITDLATLPTAGERHQSTSSGPTGFTSNIQQMNFRDKEPRRYRGRTLDERREQRRGRLLDAALELFATLGYQNTPVDRLCSTAGVTGRHFYEEYLSREALLTALFDDITASALVTVTEAVEEAPVGLRERLDAGVAAYMHLLLDDPRRARIVAVEVVGVSAKLEAHRRWPALKFAEFISSEATVLREAGEPITGNELTVLALLAAIHELTSAWVMMPNPIPVDDLIAEAVRIINAVAVAPIVSL